MIETLGRLLSYPQADTLSRAEGALRTLPVDAPAELKAGLSRFTHEAQAIGLYGLEELYTRTFDMNPSYSLEMGWHLYGEQYERGAFLVKMRERMRLLGVRETSELPDHLSNALAVLERMDPKAAASFAAESLAPAFEKLLGRFTDEENPYRGLLLAVDALVKTRAAETAGATP